MSKIRQLCLALNYYVLKPKKYVMELVIMDGSAKGPQGKQEFVTFYKAFIPRTMLRIDYRVALQF